MMESEEEAVGIRTFVRDQLRGEPDLSTLTLGILKKRYLAHSKSDSLSPEAKKYMKQVVEEEIMKMQDNDNSGSEPETNEPQSKRKREEEDEEFSEREEESRAKKKRTNHSSSSESEDKEDCKTGSDESEDEKRIKSGSDDEEQEVKKSPQKINGKSRQEMSSDDSSDESDEKGSESQKKSERAKNEDTKSDNTSEAKKTPQTDEENESDADSKSDESSDDSDKEEKTTVEKKNNDSDSDSSSLPSLEDEPQTKSKNKGDKKKNKSGGKDENKKSQKDEDRAVNRLKRYIALCGVKRNYKKLFEDCRSIKSKVKVLKKELEDLGVQGNPSIKKCKKARLKREEAQELAALDVNNIITTQGRPKRRGAWQEQLDPPPSAYQRALDSGSDGDQEKDAQKGRKRVMPWANLQGIISDDADSD